MYFELKSIQFLKYYVIKQSHSLDIIVCIGKEFKFHMIYVIEGTGALVNEKGEEQPIKAGDFALVMPDEMHQYRNKGDVPFKIICGVPKEFE
jgi:glyoxylate utilization-related uncharacterized protein